MRRLIFGSGIVADTFLNTFKYVQETVVGIVVSNGLMKPENKYPVYYVSEIGNVEFDEICIVNSHFETVEQVLSAGVCKEKIVIGYIGLMQEYMKKYGALDIKVKLPAVLTNQILNTIDVYGDDIIEINGNEFVYNTDYCRRGTFKLAAKEIKENNVEGAVAELGVYQGDFSKYINAEFADRKLYLFDTFKGFDNDQTRKNISSGFSSDYDIKNSDFSNTSIELVMNKMKYPEQIVIRQGLFPATVPEEEVKYAFVSIDCDLYEPILDGIRYFYPHMSEGGYIFIHDYNNPKFAGGGAARNTYVRRGKRHKDYEDSAA